jgi:hypothetical protein
MPQTSFQLTQQQKDFFDTFGYLALPGVMKDDIGWLTEEFEAVFRDHDAQHDGSIRSILVPFIDQRERLCTLLDHPTIVAVAAGLLGPDFNYAAGDGNFYTGDTGWHSDGWHDVGKFIKIAFYLDPVTRDTGCLRVIPGTHRRDMANWDSRQAANSEDLWGMPQNEVPAVALETQPGDLVVFNHNIMHASFGGSARRRMFTMNLCGHCHTAEEIAELESYIAMHRVFWIQHMHSQLMRNTASPERMRHLRQVMEHESHLPELTAQARAEGRSGFGAERVLVPVDA